MDNPALKTARRPGRRIVIDIDRQSLFLLAESEGVTRLLKQYPVSTAKKGVGQQEGSECTPLGPHVVRARIGAGLPEGSVLVGRRPTGEIFSPEMASREPGRDWILSRILWLSGTVIGHNRLGGVDTMRRYIYTHGAPDGSPVGTPASHGCVRMRNRDVIELFECVPAGTPVEIREKGGWR